MTDDPRYPIGRPDVRNELTTDERAERIAAIESFPARLRAVVEPMSDDQLDTPYRDGGWTVRQVVHHVPDSHVNAYVRFKLTQTEDVPQVRAYEEQLWAELEDGKHGPIDLSLPILDTVHRRWVTFRRQRDPEDFSRRCIFSNGREITMDGLLCIYSWHCDHHLAHITRLRDRMGW